MSFEVVRYTPEWRASLVALLARVGTTQLSDEEFTWWFDRNPGGEGIVSLAVDEGEVVGVAAMSFFTTRLNGVERRLAIPVNVATDARYRGQGVFSTLEERNEEAASASGSPLTVTFPNAKSYPIFVRRLGWIDLPRLRMREEMLKFVDPELHPNVELEDVPIFQRLLNEYRHGLGFEPLGVPSEAPPRGKR